MTEIEGGMLNHELMLVVRRSLTRSRRVELVKPVETGTASVVVEVVWLTAEGITAHGYFAKSERKRIEIATAGVTLEVRGHATDFLRGAGRLWVVTNDERMFDSFK